MFLCCYLPRFINIASHVKTLHELKWAPNSFLLCMVEISRIALGDCQNSDCLSTVNQTI